MLIAKGSFHVERMRAVWGSNLEKISMHHLAGSICATAPQTGKANAPASHGRGYFLSPESEGWPPSASRCAPNHFGGARSPARLWHPPGPHAPPACPTARRLPCRVTRRPRTDPTAASAPPAKRPRDSEGSHQLIGGTEEAHDGAIAGLLHRPPPAQARSVTADLLQTPRRRR